MFLLISWAFCNYLIWLDFVTQLLSGRCTMYMAVLIKYFGCSAATGARERLPLLMCIFVWINQDSRVGVATGWVSCFVPVSVLSYF